MNTSTQVIRAPEPSVVLGNDDKSLLKHCAHAKETNHMIHKINQKMKYPPVDCTSVWAESLGTRSSMGKLLLQNHNKQD